MARVDLSELPHWHQQLCKRLRATRKEAGYTMVQTVKTLSDMGLGVYQPDLSDYERGKTVPSLGTLYALAKVYDVDVYALMGPRDEP